MRRHTTRRVIEFVDTDMGGIVHFSRYAVFVETAEHRFREAVGHPVHTVRDGRPIGWPRVAFTCEYLSPARFGDTLEIDVELDRMGAKSMTMRYEVRVGDRPVVRGTMTSVCCVLDPAGSVASIPIPDDVRAAFAAD